MIELTREPIDLQRVLDAVRSPRAGAVVTFDGRVRNHSGGKQVQFLYYEAYPPMAERELERIAEEARRQWPIEQLAVVHRWGRLEIGDVSVFIAVSSAHRADAFSACRYVIEEIKKSVPIWKKEYFCDGEVWVDPSPDGDPSGEKV